MSNDSNSVEDILSASLNDAFSSVPTPEHTVKVPVEPKTTLPTSEPAVTPLEPSEAVESTLPSSEIDVHKAEYDAQLAKWRAQSAEAREKAEKERARWEAIRAEEQRSNPNRQHEEIPGPGHHEAGWETVSAATSHTDATPSVADARDLVTGEPEKQPSTSFAETEVTPPPTNSQTSTIDESQKWEDIPSSLTSSYPSMSYPEHMDSPPTQHHHPAPVQQAPPLNATVAIFDSSLSTRARVKALLSSLAINMLLPFVNGVMLGFGEIFAKNVVMEWFGWRATTPVAASTGIGASARVPKEYRTVQKAS